MPGVLRVRARDLTRHQVPLVRADGRLIHIGTRKATTHGHLVGADDTLYAHASIIRFNFNTP